MQIPQGGIAFFDSGIGGLTVLHTCLPYLRNENIYYLGDNIRAPYGNLPFDKVAAYVDEAMGIFLSLRVKAVVLACNTATAVCVERLRQRFSFPIIGAEPAVLSAAKEGGEVYVLATVATINSARFYRLCEKANAMYKKAIIRPFACPTLAGEIEKNIGKTDMDVTPFLPKGNPSSVVLGCTHYIYAKKQVESYYGCPIFDGNEGIAKRLTSCIYGQKNAPLCSNNRDEQPLLTTQKPPQIFFLKDENGYNKRVFEQMFVK